MPSPEGNAPLRESLKRWCSERLSVRMRCPDVEARLAEYADDALTARERERFAAHLKGCESCRRELEAHHQAMESLNSAAKAPAPDLWAGFQARLAAEAPALSCEKAR